MIHQQMLPVLSQVLDHLGAQLYGPFLQLLNRFHLLSIAMPV